MPAAHEPLKSIDNSEGLNSILKLTTSKCSVDLFFILESGGLQWDYSQIYFMLSGSI